jgi:hypothetical protein
MISLRIIISLYVVGFEHDLFQEPASTSLRSCSSLLLLPHLPLTVAGNAQFGSEHATTSGLRSDLDQPVEDG